MFEWLKRLLAPAATVQAPLPATPVRRPAPPVAPAAPTPTPSAERAAPPAGGPDFEQKDLVNTTFNRWLFNAAADETLDMNPAEHRTLNALAMVAESNQSAADMLRRMPGVIPQLLQSLRSEHFAGADIARKISNDMVLVAAVIRLANGAIHQSGGANGAIQSVEHAVIVIGQEGLRHLITTIAFRPIIDLNSGYYTRLLAPRLWEQSERCAVACRTLAPEFGVEPFEAFLAGLVQNAGLMTSLRLMDQNAGGDKLLGSSLFCSRLQRQARAIAANIAGEWHFPPAITKAISEQDALGKAGPASAMGRLLALSDYLSKVKLLTEQRRLDAASPGLFHALPPSALRCYANLQGLANDEAA